MKNENNNNNNAAASKNLCVDRAAEIKRPLLLWHSRENRRDRHLISIIS